MRARALWSARIYVGVGACLLTLAGCGEIDQCKEGEDGCLYGVPLDGACRFDLVLDTDRTVCVRANESESGDAGSDDDDVDGPPLENPCNCSANQVCQPDGSCVDLCLVPNPVTARESLPLCREKTYSFQEAAIAACTQACARRAALCNETCDPAVSCSAAGAITWLATVDPTCVNNPECAMKQCEAARDRPCASQQCSTPTVTPSCADVSCSDTCKVSKDEDYNLDGVCDDGDLSNAISAICKWGSDCGDCGPRRGAAPAAVKKLGEQCIDPFQCGAPYKDFSSVPAWCVSLDEESALEHCVPDCTNAPHSCPPTFDCQKLRFKDETGKETNIEDAAKRVARACFPTMCGG